VPTSPVRRAGGAIPHSRPEVWRTTNRLYPIFLDLEGRRCLVVGGGRVAERKAAALLDAGARVSVVAPRIDPVLMRRAEAGDLTVEVRPFAEGDLDGAVLVIAATDDEAVNQAVWQATRLRGVLCNVVDKPGQCDFHVPAVLRRGRLQVAFSTNGQAPAVGATLRDAVDATFGETFERVVESGAALRDRIRQRHPDDARRRMDLQARLMDREALLEALRSGDRVKLDCMLESWISCSLD
jgi:siroheme synthase-like protein